MIRKTVLLVCFIAFGWNALCDILDESKVTIMLCKTYYGLDESRRKALLFPDTWRIIDKVSGIVPEDSRIMVHTDDFNEMLYLTYGLFPRRVYLSPDVGFHYLPSKENLDLDREWLARKRIEWAVVRTDDNMIRILKIEEGRVLAETHFPG